MLDDIIVNRITRSQRRTLALIINSNGDLMVRAPLKASNATIQKFILQKSNWIINKQLQAKQSQQNNPPKQFVNGERFLYLGNSYPLKLVDDQKITLTDSLLFPTSLLPDPIYHLTRWYQDQARQKLFERVTWYSNHTGIKFRSFRISNAKHSFGSCSHLQTLRISWRLIMAPLSVIDYVVIHELAHIIHHNHSKFFWNQVATILPEYKQSRIWLKKNHHSLDLNLLHIPSNQ